MNNIDKCMKDTVLESLKKWFDDPVNVEKFQEDIKRDIDRRNRYYNKLNSLSQEEFDIFVQKCIDKYESDEYRDKEYFVHKREPMCSLYDTILGVAEIFGQELEVTEDFQAEKILYRGWIVELFIGQGSFVRVYRDGE